MSESTIYLSAPSIEQLAPSDVLAQTAAHVAKYKLLSSEVARLEAAAKKVYGELNDTYYERAKVIVALRRGCIERVTGRSEPTNPEEKARWWKTKTPDWQGILDNDLEISASHANDEMQRVLDPDLFKERQMVQAVRKAQERASSGTSAVSEQQEDDDSEGLTPEEQARKDMYDKLEAEFKGNAAKALLAIRDAAHARIKSGDRSVLKVLERCARMLKEDDK